jgi:diadenosine tetraphosphatase ApaH/serine/threonine PP2A family protein phosphatase
VQIALISDVHGNLPALEACLGQIDAVGVDQVWCLGDTVGYGPSVNECLELVLERCSQVLAGNHDLAARGDYPAGHFGGTAGHGIKYAIKHLSPVNVQQLQQLKAFHHTVGEELYHASSVDPVWEYVKDRRSASTHLAAQTHPLSFVGHSHLQLAFARQDDGSAVGDIVLGGGSLVLDERRTVVNPGSVGQPRDNNPQAGWALYDDDARTIAWYRTEYDLEAAQAAVRAAGLPERTAARLAEGR